MENVLIVTHRRGFEADPVIDELRNRGVKVFRFNCDAGDHASKASYTLKGETVQISLMCDNLVLDGNDITIGWCQQLPPYLSQAACPKEVLQRQNLWAQQAALFKIIDIPWINSPYAIQNASNKIMQLDIAQKSGLNTPLTLVSNNPQDIRRFVENNTAIAKNLATPWLTSDVKQTYAAFTKKVDSTWLHDENALAFCPVIYQKFCKRSRDYRVVVIGDKHFAVACKPSKNQEEDIRRDCPTGDNFYPVEIDNGIVVKLRSVMKKLSVEYCSADFMEDSHGNMFFLEMNLCGAWWWVDRLYNGAICQTFANFLEKK